MWLVLLNSSTLIVRAELNIKEKCLKTSSSDVSDETCQEARSQRDQMKLNKIIIICLKEVKDVGL